jgi:hypothetical protein
VVERLGGVAQQRGGRCDAVVRVPLRRWSAIIVGGGSGVWS